MYWEQKVYIFRKHFLMLPPLSSHPLCRFSRPAQSDNLSRGAGGGGYGKNLSQEGWGKVRQYITPIFHKQGWSVSGSCDGKFWNISLLSFLDLTLSISFLDQTFSTFHMHRQLIVHYFTHANV